MTLSLDINRLEKVCTRDGQITARCPACAASGHDRSGNHLFINTKTGQFGCAVLPGDSEHRREIFALAGIKSERDPAEERLWRLDRIIRATEEHARRKVSTALRAMRDTIIAAHPWPVPAVCEDSPEQRPKWLQDPRRFLAALFPPESVIWTGAVNQSGRNHSARWQTVATWQTIEERSVGPMVSPSTWPTGTVSRSAENVATAPFVVLDFDGFDGTHPRTSAELRAHLAASLAITRWLRVVLEWKLAAILFTGGKSLHSWFHTPPQVALESLKHTAPALGVDGGLIGRPEHPCRLPGHRHAKTNNLSYCLWLQLPMLQHSPVTRTEHP